MYPKYASSNLFSKKKEGQVDQIDRKENVHIVPVTVFYIT
jgi:hypothetical protein